MYLPLNLAGSEISNAAAQLRQYRDQLAAAVALELPQHNLRGQIATAEAKIRALRAAGDCADLGALNAEFPRS